MLIFHHLFTSCDTGSIDVPEMSIAMKALGFEVSHSELGALMESINQNGSGMVDLLDFEKVVLEQMRKVMVVPHEEEKATMSKLCNVAVASNRTLFQSADTSLESLDSVPPLESTPSKWKVASPPIKSGKLAAAAAAPTTSDSDKAALHLQCAKLINMRDDLTKTIDCIQQLLSQEPSSFS